MFDIALDYRFGWRWLLPPIQGIVRLQGFDEAAKDFWLQTFPGLTQSDSLNEPVDLLLMCSPATPERGDLLHWVASARVVAITAEGTAANAWRKHLKATLPRVREYAMLPAHNPRVVMPLSGSHHVVAALALHRPGRRLARWGIELARLLASVGNYWLLRRRVLLIATRDENTLPQGAYLAGLTPANVEDVEDFALYLGTPDDNRKTVVLPLGTGQPQVLLKIAGSERARAAVRNEAAALGALAQTPLAPQVPRVIQLVETDSVVTLHQEYRPRTTCRTGMEGRAVVAFLQQLSELGGHFVSLAELLENLPKRTSAGLTAEVEAACLALEKKLMALASSGLQVWLQRVHGDFAPWNCACTSQGFFVYDWEESQADGLALGDAFYYSIAPVLLTQRNPDAASRLDAALHLAHKVMSGGLSGEDPYPYLALWLLSRIRQAPLYGRMAQILVEVWR